MEDFEEETYLSNLYFSFIDLAQKCKVTLNDKIYKKAELLLKKRRESNDFRSAYITEKSGLDLVSVMFSKLCKGNYIDYLIRHMTDI